MNFKDQGIILAKRNINENLLILTVLTRLHGIYSGAVRHTANKKYNFTYQTCNFVDLQWQSRLAEHLGTINCEMIKSYSYSIISNKFNLLSTQSLIALTLQSFKEREINIDLFDKWILYLQSINNISNGIRNYLDFELFILQASGYGLDLQRCVVTHETRNLAYVSPKSGKAVSYAIGKPYADKLIALPQFLLVDKAIPKSLEEVKLAFDLIAYFLTKHLLCGNQKLPIFRSLLLEYISTSKISN